MPSQATATGEPNPVNVQVFPDGPLAVSALIPIQGGSLSATAADGTLFTLTFPDGALLNDETITLTPLSGVEGLPFSRSLVGGVQMAPEGLRLLKPAVLNIISPGIVAAEGFETVAFSYHQEGQGLYLDPAEISGDTLTLEIWHFSGTGAVQASPSEIQTQQQHLPSISEDAFRQGMMEYLAIERQNALMGETDPNFGARVAAYLREGYNRFIGPLLPTALQDCEAATPILSKALGWERQVQLLGLWEEFQTEISLIEDTMMQALLICYDKEYEQCVIDNNIGHRVTMMAYLRQGALFGMENSFDKGKILGCPPNWTGEGSYHKEATNSSIETIFAYTFFITFHVLQDGTLEGTGELKKTEASMEGQGEICKDLGTSSALVFPPLQVTGTVKPDGTFQLNINNQSSTNTWNWQCSMTVQGITIGPVTQDEGVDSGPGILVFDIPGADGAQANGSKDLGGYAGTTGSANWTLQIHQQAVP